MFKLKNAEMAQKRRERIERAEIYSYLIFIHLQATLYMYTQLYMYKKLMHWTGHEFQIALIHIENIRYAAVRGRGLALTLHTTF